MYEGIYKSFSIVQNWTTYFDTTVKDNPGRELPKSVKD